MNKIKKNNRQRFIIILTFFMVIIGPTSVNAWDNCPFGEVNESYPGTCGRYTDSDQDGICDLSQSPPDTRLQSLEDNTNQQKNLSTKTTKTAKFNYYFIPILILLPYFFIT